MQVTFIEKEYGIRWELSLEIRPMLNDVIILPAPDAQTFIVEQVTIDTMSTPEMVYAKVRKIHRFID
ncbi:MULTISPECIES: hypothetical protein [Spongiibacter]|uniref:hypothetical protein n=1 Tax=Spongiibacter TaxID=630749 RepID=UPI000C67A4C5|nr:MULTISPECIES: hypothetical protein [Spongiibacter]MAY38659.1 hypothetical protein [Spongiibacter sp.]MBI58835.1 hypothetical protein [Spongiibacter sp.]|tara:strand:- start:31 stop:231 length:201 start_codon:yes stop_codon:yes gene_type:complete